jgi:hypothetical protein
MMTKRSATWIGALGLIAVTVLPLIGCGSSSPAAPSSAQAAGPSFSSSVKASAAIGGDASASLATASGDAPDAVTVSALVTGTSCPTLQFKVDGNIVQTNVSTKYEGGSCANIQAGAKLTLAGSRAGDHAVFTASLITFRTRATDSSVEGEGVVTALVSGTACPALSFLIGPHTIKVTTSTTFAGGACGDLKVGATVNFAGTRQGDGSVLASRVSVKPATTQSDPPVEGEGVVTALVSGTACPTLSFLIGPHTIKVTTSTTFAGGACGDLKVGATVNFAGTRQGDGSVLASRVSVRPATDSLVEGEGVVTGLVSGTACPTLSFLIGPYTITVTASTTYQGGTCADIKVGSRVNVYGTRQGDGSLLVTRLVLKPATHAEEPVEGEATVTSVRAGTACPALEFTLAERYVVKVTASTAYQGGTCADIKTGTKMHVRGTSGADGSVTASSVNIQAAETHHEESAEGDGGVTSLVAGTACPALRFLIEEYTIVVDSKTEYVGGTCADIKVGAKVGVKGSMAAGKIVTATRITFRRDR